MNPKQLWIPILLITILWAIFFFPAITLQGFYFHENILELNITSRAFAADQWRQGIIPLWNPYCFAGFPLLAEGQAAIFYPLNVIFLFLPAPYAYNWLTVFHYLLALLGMFYFLRSLKIGVAGTLIGSMTYGFSPYFLYQLNHITIITAMALCPAILGFAVRGFRGKRHSHLFMAGLVLGLSFLGGSPLTNIQILMLLVTLIVYLSFQESRRETLLRSFTRGMYGLIIICALGLGLAAIQLLPTLEMIPLTIRGVPPSAKRATYATLFSMSKKYLLTLLMPFFWGDPSKGTLTDTVSLFWETCAYSGILPLMLFLQAIIHGGHRHVMLFTIIMVISIFLALGHNSPLSILFTLPWTGSFRTPARFLFPYMFSLSVLAAFGIDSLIERTENLKVKRNRLLFHYFPIFPLAFATFLLIFKREFFIIVNAFLHDFHNGITGYLKRIFPDADSSLVQTFTQNLYLSLLMLSLFLGLSMLFVGLYLHHKIDKKTFVAIAVCLLFGDLYWAGASYNPLTSIGFYQRPFWANQYVENPFGPEPSYRIASFSGIGRKFKCQFGITTAALMYEYNRSQNNDLVYNVPAYLGLPALTGGSSLELRDHHRLEYAIFGGTSDVSDPYIRWDDLIQYLQIEDRDSALALLMERSHVLLDLSNVGYLLTGEILPENRWKLLTDNGPDGQRLYANPGALPRARFVTKVRSAQNADEALILYITQNIDLHNETILVGYSGHVDPLLVKPEKASLRWKEYSPLKVQIEVETPQPGFLVLADTYYPGWKAEVDGEERAVYLADICYRAVQVPLGRHLVTFHFESASFHLGLLISLISLFAWIPSWTFLRTGEKRMERNKYKEIVRRNE